MTATGASASWQKDGSSRVLVIDDDPVMRRVVIESLEREAYDLQEAASGKNGIQAAQELRPDLILLDAMMPEMDGFEVIRQLRAHPLTQGIPVIMLTALGEMSEKIRAMQLGADDYVTKPFDPRELRARVEAHLKRSEHYLDASPLTNLPGNQAIQRVIAGRLAAREPLAVIYFDLRDFKAYNDKYGWVAGDQVIKSLGEIILQAQVKQGGKDDFIGHIGGDDFVVVTRRDHAEAIAAATLRDFDRQILFSYNAEDRTRGFLEIIDRHGDPRHIPIMSLGAAIVSSQEGELTHPLQIAQHAAEVKRYLKGLPGSNYAFDRRRR